MDDPEAELKLTDDALLAAISGRLPAPRSELILQAATPTERLDAIGIDSICAMVAEGSMGPALTKRLEVPFILFDKWLAIADYRALYERALILAADSFVALAEEVITSASKASIARANALAAHYKWIAARLNPEKYSEKKTTDGGGAQEVHIHFGIPPRNTIDLN